MNSLPSHTDINQQLDAYIFNCKLTPHQYLTAIIYAIANLKIGLTRKGIAYKDK